MSVSYLEASRELAKRDQGFRSKNLLSRIFLPLAKLFSAAPSAAKIFRRRSAGGAGQRSYDAAVESRATDGWSTNGASANAEIWGNVRPVRERARDLKRNNPWIQKGCKLATNIMVGDGIRPNCTAGTQRIKESAAAYAQRSANCAEANRLWNLQASKVDAVGNLSIYALQALAWDAMFSDGDVLQRRRWRSARDASLTLPYQIELLEADYLVEWKNQMLEDGGRIIQGIEFNKIGRPRKYWLYSQHPGDGWGPLGTAYSVDAIAAADIAHGYVRERPGQVRGMCQFAAAVIPARNYDDCTHSVRLTYRSSSNVIGVVSTTQTDDELFGTPDNDSAESSYPGAVVAADGTPLDEMRPATFAIMRNGSTCTFNNPQAPQGVREYMKAELHGIAAAFALSYAMLSGDMDGTTYATWRAQYAECLEVFGNLRELHMIPTVCDPQWRWHLEACFAAGLLPGVADDYPVEWSTPKPFGFDRNEEAKTSKDLVRIGQSSTPREIRKMGDDPDVIFAEIVEFRAKCKAAGIVFDSDPNETNLAGAPRITEKAVVPAPTGEGAG